MIQKSCYKVKSLAKILELSLGNDPRQTKGESMFDDEQLKRIADAIEEILRLVKKDQEDSAARQRQWDHEKN